MERDRISFLTLALAKKGGGSGGLRWLGVTTTTIADGDTTNPVEINGVEVTAEDGDVVQYGTSLFSFNGEVWQTYTASVTVEDGCITFS